MEKGVKQAGLEFLRDPSHTIEEVAAAVSGACPPVGLTHCSVVACRECWTHWLRTGEALPATKCPGEVAAT